MGNAGKVSKRFVILLVVVIFVVCAGVTVYFVTKTQAKHKAKYERHTRIIFVLPGETRMQSFSITDVPCAIRGIWRSKDTDAEYANGDENILADISMVIVYNTDGSVARMWENEASGNFSMDVTKPGEIRFDFFLKKNKSKSTSRKITLNVKIQ